MKNIEFKRTFFFFGDVKMLVGNDEIKIGSFYAIYEVFPYNELTKVKMRQTYVSERTYSRRTNYQ